MRMKILYVTPVFYPEVGGGEKYMFNLAREVAKKHEVIVITSAKSFAGKKRIGNFLVYYLNYKEYFGTEYIPIRTLFQLIGRIRPDIIHGSGPSITQDAVFILSKVFRIPMIMTYHGNPNRDKLISRIYIKLATSLLLKRMCKIIVTSNMIYSQMTEKRKFSRRRVVLIPVGVELPKFKQGIQNKDRIRSKFNLKGKKIILFVGGLGIRHRHKRPDLLINAIVSVIKEVPNVHLLIVGQGELLPKYIAETNRLQLQEIISFHTNVKDEDLPYYYSAADVFVLPSPTEPFGIVLLEAMSVGLPVIASENCGGKLAIIEGKSGLIFRSADISDLSEKIIKILKDSSLASKLGQNGINYVQKYDWARIAKEVENVYTEILSNRKQF